MINEDIHLAFVHESIRDFLSKNIGHGYENEVLHITQRISDLQAELEAAKKSQAARDLIKSNGWKEFDVSDEIEDYKRGEYFPFVGTDEEHKALMLEIKNEVTQ